VAVSQSQRVADAMASLIDAERLDPGGCGCDECKYVARQIINALAWSLGVKSEMLASGPVVAGYLDEHADRGLSLRKAISETN